VVESIDHVANENRIAFWVATPEAVDRLADIARSAGANDLSGRS
jgi:hypothetical protein